MWPCKEIVSSLECGGKFPKVDLWGGEEGRVVERERKEETGQDVKGKKRGRSRWEERKRGNHVRELHDY